MLKFFALVSFAVCVAVCAADMQDDDVHKSLEEVRKYVVQSRTVGGGDSLVEVELAIRDTVDYPDVNGLQVIDVNVSSFIYADGSTSIKIPPRPFRVGWDLSGQIYRLGGFPDSITSQDFDRLISGFKEKPLTNDLAVELAELYYAKREVVECWTAYHYGVMLNVKDVEELVREFCDIFEGGHRQECLKELDSLAKVGKTIEPPSVNSSGDTTEVIFTVAEVGGHFCIKLIKVAITDAFDFSIEEYDLFSM